jgi:hypothetical protein
MWPRLSIVVESSCVLWSGAGCERRRVGSRCLMVSNCSVSDYHCDPLTSGETSGEEATSQFAFLGNEGVVEASD